MAVWAPTGDEVHVSLIVSIKLMLFCNRMFHHHRIMYKHFHEKHHHEWTAPVALTALYNHPVDHLISNILHTVLGPALMQPYIFTNWLWLTWAFFRTLLATCWHSVGYEQRVSVSACTTFVTSSSTSATEFGA